ncbi:MAG: hypothetical protein MUF54_10655, partial [Polyangiaceae bacterium]|nr:hypothetical protein [Polyangiaceae bacterium]
APPAPRPPTPDELLDQVLDLYLKDHKIPKGVTPSFDFVTNVAGDQRNERILCHDRDLVVFGKGFREGRAYVSLSMAQFSRGQDILDVNARDVTGDGRADILVRGVQRAQAPEQLGTGEVVREVLFVYTVAEPGITRVFAAETAISHGERRLHSTVAFLPGSAATAIELRPGRSVGWSRRSWPFQQDTEAVSGVEPIVLPWTATPVRYRFAGLRYQR